MWTTTPAETVVKQTCAYGGVAGTGGVVTRQCNEYGIWDQVNLTQCLTMVQYSLHMLNSASVSFTVYLCMPKLWALFTLQLAITDANIAMVTSTLNNTLVSITADDQTLDNLNLISTIFVIIANAQVNFNGPVSHLLLVHCYNGNTPYSLLRTWSMPLLLCGTGHYQYCTTDQQSR